MFIKAQSKDQAQGRAATASRRKGTTLAVGALAAALLGGTAWAGFAPGVALRAAPVQAFAPQFYAPQFHAPQFRAPQTYARPVAQPLLRRTATVAPQFRGVRPVAQPIARPVAPTFVAPRAVAQPGFVRPVVAQPVVAQPVVAQPVPVRPAVAQAQFVQPGFVQPGFVQPGFVPQVAAQYAQPLPPVQRRDGPFTPHNNLLKAGALGFFLQDSSDNVSGPLTPPELQVDVGDEVTFAGSYTRHIGDHFGIEIPIGAPTEFGIDTAAGAVDFIGDGQIATVDALPITAIANVYFTDRSARIRPYLGLAVNHTIFSDETATPLLEEGIFGETDIELDSSTNIGAFAGLNLRLSDNLHASLLGGYVNVDTTATITTDTVIPLFDNFGIPLGEFTREVDIELNPIVGFASLGFSF